MTGDRTDGNETCGNVLEQVPRIEGNGCQNIFIRLHLLNGIVDRGGSDTISLFDPVNHAYNFNAQFFSNTRDFFLYFP
ncbi:MAG: hypothetical protein RBG13Loki_1754 [Promethearchaeota archaeon CR_4]|nr:MAG: hypothetical protein RBG13Loki_1754 [Candidatus Lokiarchaeota archaeon CR_4]